MQNSSLKFIPIRQVAGDKFLESNMSQTLL